MTRTSNIETGKLPPQAVDFEEAVLGAIMMEKRALFNVIELLKPESFYKEAHIYIYEAILELSNKFEPIDIMTVTNVLRKSGKLDIVGGAYYLMNLTNRVASAANISYHASVVREKYILREVIRLAAETQKAAFDDGSEFKDVIDNFERGLTAITCGVIQNAFKTSGQLYKEAIENNDNLLKNDGLTGVTTGLNALDRITGGFQNSDLIILAARPGMGKTALALNLVTAPAFRSIPTGFFSLEMNNKQLYARVLSQVTGVDLEIILRKGMNELDLKRVLNKSAQLCEANIYFDDTPAMSLFELRNKARRLVREKGVKQIVVDYLQLMTNPIKGSNREGEISSISRGLKAIAKELDIPIIALAQLSRASEKRGASAVPMLSDLRESGSIEQDADMVMFIYRHEYYSIFEDEDGNSTIGMAQIIVAKHRNGDTGKVPLKFEAKNTNFTDVKIHDFTPAPF